MVRSSHFASVLYIAWRLWLFFILSRGLHLGAGCWSHPGHDWDMIYVLFLSFQLLVSIFGQASSIVSFLFLAVSGRGIDRGWALTRIYTREPREPCVFKCISYYVYRSGAQKKQFGVWVLLGAAYNRYHITVSLYMCVFLLKHIAMRSLGVTCVVCKLQVACGLSGWRGEERSTQDVEKEVAGCSLD